MNDGTLAPMTPRLLVVDDEIDLAELVAATADHVGFDTTVLTDPMQFDQIYQQGPFQVIVIDLVMPKRDGIELLRFLGEKKSAAAILLISGYDISVLTTARQLANAHGLQNVQHLQKPFRLDELEQLLTRLIPDHALAKIAPLIRAPQITALDIEEGLLCQEFRYVYQPQIAFDNQRVIGFEALMRWPARPSVGPDQFIPVAEANDLIDLLTWSVLTKALGEFRQLAELVPDCTISINMSPYSLSDLDWPDRLAALLAETGIQPQQVIIEITESGLIQDLNKALDVLARLRIKGFGMSIDDFGTGSATFEQLRRMPLTELKIDRSFIAEYLEVGKSHFIVEKTIDMAHDIGLRVVAEGIENIKVSAALRDAGADVAQGYLYFKPLEFADIMTSVVGNRASTDTYDDDAQHHKQIQ